METMLIASLVFMVSIYCKYFLPDIIEMSELSQSWLFSQREVSPGPRQTVAQDMVPSVTACCGSSSEWDQLAEKISSGSPGEARPDRGAGGLEPVSQWFYLISRHDGQAKCCSYFLLVNWYFQQLPSCPLPARPGPQITESCSPVNLQLPAFTGFNQRQFLCFTFFSLSHWALTELCSDLWISVISLVSRPGQARLGAGGELAAGETEIWWGPAQPDLWLDQIPHFISSYQLSAISFISYQGLQR